MTEDRVVMKNQRCRGKCLDQALDRMSVGFTVSNELDLQEPNQRKAGVQVTVLQDGTVGTYPGGDRREIIVQQEYGILVRDPHGISSCNKFQIFEDELLQDGLVTYFSSMDSIQDEGLSRFALSKHQIDREINGDLMTTNWLVCSQVQKPIVWSRISNVSGEASQVVEIGCNRDGIIIYLLKDKKSMLTVILLEVRERVKLIGMPGGVHLSDGRVCHTLIVAFVLQPKEQGIVRNRNSS